MKKVVYDNYAPVVGCSEVFVKVIYDGKAYYQGVYTYENNSVSSVGWGNYSTIKNKCNELKLIFKIDNLDYPQVVYNIISPNCEIDKDMGNYKVFSNRLQEIKAFFDVINNEKTSKKKKFIYCRSCGAKNDSESLKCVSCGDKL